VSEPRTSGPTVPRRRALVTIFVTVLLDLIGFGMILPLLPFYAQEFQATPFQIGVLFASYSLAQLVFAPLLGRASDRLGRRPVLLASIAGGSGAYLLFAFAPGFGWLLVARTLSGVAAANFATAQAYMADVSTPETRSQAMGLIGAAFGLGFILGPALGGLLAQAGHQMVPLAAAALSALNLLIASVWLRESLSPELRERLRERPWLDLAGVVRVGRDKSLGGLMALFFLVMFAFSMMEATLALFCQARLGFGAAETSWLFVYVGVVLVVVQGGLLGRLVRRFGERQLILGGIVLMALGLGLLPFTPGSVPPDLLTAIVLLASLSLLAVGSGMHNPSTLGLLSRLTDQESQGGTIGLSRSFGSLARTLGPMTGTYIFGAAGISWPFWTASGLLLVALLLAVGVLQRAPAG
jgi:MFS transporter, DHA1 family, tetracycline resistance protein